MRFCLSVIFATGHLRNQSSHQPAISTTLIPYAQRLESRVGQRSDDEVKGYSANDSSRRWPLKLASHLRDWSSLRPVFFATHYLCGRSVPRTVRDRTYGYQF